MGFRPRTHQASSLILSCLRSLSPSLSVRSSACLRGLCVKNLFLPFFVSSVGFSSVCFMPSTKHSKLRAASLPGLRPDCPVGHFDNWEKQQHQIFPALDLNFSPDWEFNLGIGIGLTRSTEDLMVKLILGRRF